MASNLNISIPSNLNYLNIIELDVAIDSILPSTISSPNSKDPLQLILTSPPKSGTLPTHLKLLPPTLAIPEGYKWIFIHGEWMLIPSVNSDKFYSQDPSPRNISLDNPSDEELVDWGEDEDEDFLTDEIAEDDHFLEEENFIQPKNAFHIDDLVADQPTDSHPDRSRNDKVLNDSNISEIIPDQPSISIPPCHIRRSDNQKAFWSLE